MFQNANQKPDTLGCVDENPGVVLEVDESVKMR